MSSEPGSKGIIILVISIFAMLAGMIYLYFVYPEATAGPEQPIPFSHRLHVDIKELDCLFCHSTVETARAASIPPVEKCLYCHDHIIPEHPYIKKLKGYQESETPIPWVKVTSLPDHVYFSHQRHIRAGEDCSSCHGDVASLDRIKIGSGGGSELKMGFCLECHQQPVANNSKAIGHEQSVTSAELIEQAQGEYSGIRAPVDCWTCHQ